MSSHVVTNTEIIVTTRCTYVTFQPSLLLASTESFFGDFPHVLDQLQEINLPIFSGNINAFSTTSREELLTQETVVTIYFLQS